MNQELTTAQSRVLDFIRKSMVEHGWPPTRAEIAAAMGYRSPNAVQDHLKAIQRKGYIELIPDISRGIRLTAMPTEQISMMDVLSGTVNPLHRPVLGLNSIKGSNDV
jgi:repressor LexA